MKNRLPHVSPDEPAGLSRPRSSGTFGRSVMTRRTNADSGRAPGTHRWVPDFDRGGGSLPAVAADHHASWLGKTTRFLPKTRAPCRAGVRQPCSIPPFPPHRSSPPMATLTLFSPAAPLQVVCIESQPFGENTYVVFRADAGGCCSGRAGGGASARLAVHILWKRSSSICRCLCGGACSCMRKRGLPPQPRGRALCRHQRGGHKSGFCCAGSSACLPHLSRRRTHCQPFEH